MQSLEFCFQGFIAYILKTTEQHKTLLQTKLELFIGISEKIRSLFLIFNFHCTKL